MGMVGVSGECPCPWLDVDPLRFRALGIRVGLFALDLEVALFFEDVDPAAVPFNLARTCAVSADSGCEYVLARLTDGALLRDPLTCCDFGGLSVLRYCGVWWAGRDVVWAMLYDLDAE